MIEKLVWLISTILSYQFTYFTRLNTGHGSWLHAQLTQLSCIILALGSRASGRCTVYAVSSTATPVLCTYPFRSSILCLSRRRWSALMSTPFAVEEGFSSRHPQREKTL